MTTSPAGPPPLGPCELPPAQATILAAFLVQAQGGGLVDCGEK